MTENRAINIIEYTRTFDEFKGTAQNVAFDMAILALEKQIPKKPIRKEMTYSEEVGFNDEWYCPVCNSYVGYFTEGMSEPEQMEYCNECGQHIARDWSEDND